MQAVGVAPEKYGEEVGSFIISKEGAEPDEVAVAEFCRGRIARHKIPQYMFFVDGFPLTRSGKIQKFKLREMSLRLLKERGIKPD